MVRTKSIRVIDGEADQDYFTISDTTSHTELVISRKILPTRQEVQECTKEELRITDTIKLVLSLNFQMTHLSESELRTPSNLEELYQHLVNPELTL